MLDYFSIISLLHKEASSVLLSAFGILVLNNVRCTAMFFKMSLRTHVTSERGSSKMLTRYCRIVENEIGSD